MPRTSTPTGFLILLAGAAAYVWATSRNLPDVVAAHFAASGVANGFMLHAVYLRFTLVVVVALPFILVFLARLALKNPDARINLPNSDYWLAPDRRAETIAFLRRHFVRFGCILVVFLCYVHWLVVRANALQPPNLSSRWFVGGLAGLLTATLIWASMFLSRFRLRPG